MSKKFILPSVLSLFSKGKKESEVKVPSQKIEQKKEEKPEQISKCKLQRMKGKRNRKNRGRNRRE